MIPRLFFCFVDGCSWALWFFWKSKLSNASSVQSSRSCRIFSFQHPFAYLNLPAVDVWFERFKHSVMLQTETWCIKKRGVENFEQGENQKLFTPGSFLEHQWRFWNFFTSCVWRPSIVLSVKKWISKSYSHCWMKGSNMQKSWENWRICRTWGFLWRTAQFNCSEQTRDSMNNHHKTKEQS